MIAGSGTEWYLPVDVPGGADRRRAILSATKRGSLPRREDGSANALMGLYWISVNDADPVSWSIYAEKPGLACSAAFIRKRSS